MQHALNLPADSVTAPSIVEFCSLGLPENERLEYKQEFSSKNTARSVAKEVSAFANTQGGTILYGVEEDGNRRPASEQPGRDLGKNPRQTVLTACAQKIFPPVHVEVSEYVRDSDDDSQGFLVVRVPLSEDVHRVLGDGTGVYIRMADQSEPVPAPLDTIELLLNRRRLAREQQTIRRLGAMECLRLVVGPEEQWEMRGGVVWVSIGPDVLAERIVANVRDLQDKHEDYVIRSQYFRDSNFPVDRTDHLRGYLDGVYSVGYSQDHGGAMDVFGNIAAFSCLARSGDRFEWPLHDEEVNRIGLRIALRWGRDQDAFLSVRAEMLAERLFASINAARQFATATQFAGVLRGNVRAISNLVPITCKGNWQRNVVGWCPTTEEICFDFTLSTEEIRDVSTIATPVDDVFQRLMWAWGCTTEAAFEQAIILGERNHFGSKACAQCDTNVSLNRTLCPNCGKRR